MKNLATALSVIALIGVIVLTVLFANGKKTAAGSDTKDKGGLVNANEMGATGNVAYIDIDTFEANYTLLKDKKAEFSKKKDAMEAELQRSGNQLANEARSLQAKASTMTQAEGQAAEKRIYQMQQSFDSRRQSMELQFGKEQEAFNKSLRDQLDSFLAEYNSTHHYDYVLSYSRSNPQIMYANSRLNITADVIKGMNERAAATKAK